MASTEFRTVLYAVTLAAAGIGTLAIARVPSAAVIFCGIICSALSVTALRITNNASLVLAVMTLIFMALSIGIVLSMHRAAVGRALGTSELNRQSEIISLLLKDFDRAEGDWLWQTDRQGRIVFASERLAEITGRPADSLIGQTLRSLARANPDDAGWPEFADALATARDHSLDRSDDEGRHARLLATHRATALWRCRRFSRLSRRRPRHIQRAALAGSAGPGEGGRRNASTRPRPGFSP